MKTLICLIVAVFSLSVSASSTKLCKTIRDCSDWASANTGIKYELGKYERRSLKFDKDFTLNNGEADFLFGFILQSNDFARIKRESGAFQIIQMKELKEFQFPSVKVEEIPANFDFYSVEFSLPNSEMVKNALLIVKKYLSKNGRALEVAHQPKIQVIDTGFHLNFIKSLLYQFNR